MIKKDARKRVPAPDLSEFHLYEALDPIPVPDAVESDAEAAWALWDHAQTRQQQEDADEAAELADMESNNLHENPPTRSPSLPAQQVIESQPSS